MNPGKAHEALLIAQEIAKNAKCGTDFHNAFFGIGGKFGELFPTRGEREAFSSTPEYQEIVRLRAALPPFVASVGLPKDDPFWQRMQAIWAIPKARGDGGEDTLTEVSKLRKEWDEHQQTALVMIPIGLVRSPRTDLKDDNWGTVLSQIELADSLPSESLDGIEQFSHVEIVYFFNRVPEAEIEYGSRHPRGNTAWPKVGIFAQRGKGRPNRLGITIAEVVSREGRVLIVRGLDAIDGTPVLDIKPVMAEFLPRGQVRQPDWSHELMRDYW